MPLLLLVDGSSYLYRAFHALPDLRNKAGEPTGALYGVLNMLRRLESDYKADYKAVVFDAKGKTFRDDWYPEYKAHRPPMPPEMVGQIEPLHAAIRAAGWPLLMVDGVEADDVIGTLATRAAVNGVETLISTGDKDLTQLVGPHVRWYNTMSNELLDEAGVAAKFGVPPAKMVDYLALVGDTVDGVPGVQKCGPKTAVKWLEQYGSLDGIVAHAGEIGGVVGDNLRGHLDFLPLGRKLVTVVRDLPDLPAPTALTATGRDAEALRELFARFEFRTWLKELESSPPPAAEEALARATPHHPPPATVSYETVFSWQQLDAWLARIEAAELTALDTETTSLDPFAARIVGISLSVLPGEACYIPLAHTAPGVADQLPRDEVLARLKPWLESAAHRKVLQNAKYDQHVLANHGIALAGIAHDTMLQSYVIESDKGHDLGQLCTRHLGLDTIAYADLCGKGAKQIGFDQVDIERAATYAAEDADVTLRVHAVLHPHLAEEPGLSRIYHEIEMPVREVIWRMERTGILIDGDTLARQSHEIGRKIMALETQAHELAGQPFNLASPKQLAEILFDKQGLPVEEEDRIGRPLDRRGSALRARARLPAAQAAARTPQPGQAQGHLYRQAAAHDQPGNRTRAHPLLAGFRRHRPARFQRSQPAEHPGAHRGRPAHPHRLHRPRGQQHRLGRLFAGRAAHHGPPLGRRTPARSFRPRRGRAPRHRRRNLRRHAARSRPRPAPRRQDDQLRPDLRHERLRPRPPARPRAQRGADLHRPLFRPLSRRRPLHGRGPRTRPASRATSRPPSAAACGSPRSVPATAMRRQGAERAAINAPMQGTAADLIKLAMIAVQGWLDASGAEVTPGAAGA